MTKWAHVVDFEDFWDSDISVESKGILVAKELSKLNKHFKENEALLDIIEGFKSISGNGTEHFSRTQDFDECLFELYEWADYRKVWIKTYF